MPSGDACLLDSNILLRIAEAMTLSMPRSAMRFTSW
jgi:hypothetical protein